MINFKEIKPDGEEWELFARDFLQELGFFIESSPDRGPDGGKDLIITENLKGNLGNYRFRWLVSCKHYATSGKSINEEIEMNILERVDAFNADGFIGFYSTIPSSGLNGRLNQLKNNNKIKDFRIFDYKLIENYLIRIGYSKLLMRYFPESYKIITPIQLITSSYLPIECKTCGKDLLKSMFEDKYEGLISIISKYDEENKIELIHDVYCACKTGCDDKWESYYIRKGFATAWEDLGDLVIPTWYLRNLFTVMNNLEVRQMKFVGDAFEKYKYFQTALAQKVLRELTEEEKKRFKELIEVESIFY